MGPFQLLVLMTIPIIAAKSIFTKTGYFPVPVCPKNTQEWQASSRRLNCNDTHKYHCAPYYDLSQLYEFCYQRTLLEVKKGNCIGIAESGILNQLTCEYFAQGCPLEDYNSSQLYKYPNCLSIYNDCHTEDCVCKCQSARKKIDTKTNKSDTVTVTTSGQKPEPASCENQTRYLTGFVICLILLIVSIAVNVVQICISLRKQSRQGCEKDESTEENIPLVHLPTVQKTDAHDPDKKYSSAERATEEIYKFTLVDYTIEDAELFQLLKRQCLHKAFPEFKYLVDTRISDERKYIFKQHDENGCSLLHYAAQGGCIVILDEVLRVSEITSNDIHEHTCIRGQNALHFAIKYNNTYMAVHLFENYPSLNNYDQNSDGAFAPIHWVAWHCNIFLLDQLKRKGVDIWAKTKNGLNILDIACMAHLSEESNKFCLHLFENENIPTLRKVDLSGWNIAHYASRSNKVDLFQLIEENENIGEEESLITKKTNTSKTCLHIACEFAKYDAVLYILTKFETILNHMDHLDWNALHYAAKGGNLIILKKLIKEGMNIGCLTTDGKTILHIACIHKHPAICKYAVKNLPKSLLNAKTNNNGLTAIHYLAVEKKEDGSETKILKILCESKIMDLSATCKKGSNILEWAIDHLNIELIRGIVSAQFRKRCGVSRQSLLDAKNRNKENQNQEIINILDKALEKMKEEQ